MDDLAVTLLLIGAVAAALLYEAAHVAMSPAARRRWLLAGSEAWEAGCNDRTVLARSAWLPHLITARWIGAMLGCCYAVGVLLVGVLGIALLPLALHAVALCFLLLAYLLDVWLHRAAQLTLLLRLPLTG